MHPRVYQEFERICATRDIRGSVLEVGAAPTDDCLLNMKALKNVSEKIGVDLGGPYEFNDFKVVKCNSNSMDCFDDARFDAVLCHAVLEHDKYFWKTVAEIKRVTKPGGWIFIGVPGYTETKADVINTILRKTPGIRRLARHANLNMFFTSTITYQIHNHPGDYYRFSPQAMTDVLFEDLIEVELHSIMLPARLICAGRKPL